MQDSKVIQSQMLTAVHLQGPGLERALLPDTKASEIKDDERARKTGEREEEEEKKGGNEKEMKMKGPGKKKRKGCQIHNCQNLEATKMSLSR